MEATPTIADSVASLCTLGPRGPIDTGTTLGERLHALHIRLLEMVPTVDRIACALYDKREDELKTFINSTRTGEAIDDYQFKLSSSASLLKLSQTGNFRVIDDIQKVVRRGAPHSDWLLEQGYRSSFTVPMYENGGFVGFIFFDSLERAAFTPRVQRDLGLFSNLINMMVANELSTVRSLIASAQLARNFANLRDFETGAHLERMARYSQIIARALASSHDLSDEFIEHVFLFAPLHDIGKIGIPDSILLKPGALTPEERSVMQTHVEKGRGIVAKILGDFALQALPDSTIMSNIVEYHHEFLDGTGYPKGVKAAQIPIEARIVTVADIFDALTCARPYKPAWSVKDACAELHRMADAGKLDAACVAAIERHVAEMADIRDRYCDPA